MEHGLKGEAESMSRYGFENTCVLLAVVSFVSLAEVRAIWKKRLSVEKMPP